jgi:hypothetical protein
MEKDIRLVQGSKRLPAQKTKTEARHLQDVEVSLGSYADFRWFLIGNELAKSIRFEQSCVELVKRLGLPSCPEHN